MDVYHKWHLAPNSPFFGWRWFFVQYALVMDELLQNNSENERTLGIFVKAMREVLTEGDEGTKALLIKKIPLLCTDILIIKGDISLIKKLGGYILLGVGSLFLTLVAALLLKGL
jgi:hypothetical protein